MDFLILAQNVIYHYHGIRDVDSIVFVDISIDKDEVAIDMFF